MDAETHFIHNKRNAKQFAIEALNNYDINVEFTDSGAAIISEPILQTKHFDDDISKYEKQIAELEQMTTEQYREKELERYARLLRHTTLRLHEAIEQETILRQELEAFKNFKPPIAEHVLGEGNPRTLIINGLQRQLKDTGYKINDLRKNYDELKETQKDYTLKLAQSCKDFDLQYALIQYNGFTEQRGWAVDKHNQKVKFLSEYLQEVERCFGEDKE